MKLARRLKESINFSVKLDLRCPEIKIDDDTLLKVNEADSRQKDFFSETDAEGNMKYDYEEIPCLKKHKILCLEEILKSNVSRKYKISFFKGL